MTLLRLFKAGLCATLLLARPAMAQLLDPAFTTPTSMYSPGQVFAMGPQQADGQRVVAGTFTRVNGTPTGQLVRLTATGALDQTFLQNVGTGASNIYRVQRFPSGQYLLASYGGNITAGSISRPEFLRLNADGTADATFNAGAGPFAGSSIGYSTGSAIQTDGKVVAVGYFDSFDNVAAGGIVRLNTNGSVDPTFSAGTGAAASGDIVAVAVQADGKILAGGSFATFNGQAADGLVRLNANGTVDTGFTPPISGSYVEGIVQQPDGKILVYGSFTVNGTYITLVRLNTNGTLDTSFATSTLAGSSVTTNGFDTALVLQPDGKLLISGYLSYNSGSTSVTLQRLNANGTSDPSFVANGPSSPANVIGLEANGSVVAGGYYNAFNGSERPLQRLSGAGVPDAAFAPSIQLPGSVAAVARQANGQLLIGGNFTELNGQTVHRLVRLSASGTLDATYTAAAGVLAGPVTALVLQPDGKALVGTSADLGRYTTTGSRDATFTPAFASNTYALALQPDGRILWASGVVSSNFRYLMRLNSTGAYDASFARPVANAGPGVPGIVDAVLVQPDGKIVVGGGFRLNGTATVARVVRYDAAGALDATFNNTSAFTVVGGTSTSVNRLYSLDIQPDGKLLVGGNFGAVNGTSRPSFARLTATGTLDAGFAPNVSLTGPVYKVLGQPNGRVLVGGSFSGFTTAGTLTNLLRVLDNGQTDTSFGPTTNPNSLVRSLLIQPDGAIVLGGGFTTVGGQPAVGTARIIVADVLSVAAPAAVTARTAAWPVPAHGQLHIAPDFSAQPRSLALLDATGRTVRTRPVTGTAEQTLDLDALAPGLYLLQVRYAAGTVTRRIAVE